MTWCLVEHRDDFTFTSQGPTLLGEFLSTASSRAGTIASSSRSWVLSDSSCGVYCYYCRRYNHLWTEHLLTYNSNHPNHDVRIKWYPYHRHEEGKGIPVSPTFLLAVRHCCTAQGVDGYRDAPPHLSPETTFSGLYQWWDFFTRMTFLRLVIISSGWCWWNWWWHSRGSLLLLCKCSSLFICWKASCTKEWFRNRKTTVLNWFAY